MKENEKGIPFRLSKDLHTKFKVATAQQQRSMNEVLIELVEMYLRITARD